MLVHTALNKIEYRKQALKIIRAQQEINQALVSAVLEAVVQLASENASYIEGLVDYYKALAQLNYASGYGLDIGRKI